MAQQIFKQMGTVIKAYVDTSLSTITPTSLGLGNVSNTADLNKPVSTATQTAITAAVGAVTPTSIGLGNVDNTSDLNKPVSTATQTAIATAITNSVKDKYDLAVTTTTGTANANTCQVFKIDNTTATTKTVNITNLPANRAMTIIIKVAGSTGTIAYTNTVSWDGGTQPTLGTAFSVIALLWDGSALTGSISQKN